MSLQSFLGGPIGSSGAPGSISPFASGAVSSAAGQGLQAMANRYSQLGLGGSTAEQMDLGIKPSLTGGIPQEAQALTGELQTSALNAPSGVSKSPATIIGGVGNLARLFG